MTEWERGFADGFAKGLEAATKKAFPATYPYSVGIGPVYDGFHSPWEVKTVTRIAPTAPISFNLDPQKIKGGYTT